jgi:hypothetical protein
LDRRKGLSGASPNFRRWRRDARTWAEWLKTAEEMEKGLKTYGHVVVRVRIEPGAYLDCCNSHHMSPGGTGRKKFVAAAVAERYGDRT